MSKRRLQERIRQLLAIDMNAEDVYLDLASLSADKRSKDVFLEIAKDEQHHILYSKALLKQLGRLK